MKFRRPKDSGGDATAATKKSAGEILKTEIKEGVSALRRSPGSLFISGLSAGLDIGFSVLLMGVMHKIAEGQLSPAVSRILTANMYSVGFVFVVMGRSELFTEQTTLAVLPVLSGRATIRSLLRLWALVFLSNMLGAALFALLAAWIAPTLDIATRANFGEVAHLMTDHRFGTIFCSAVLAGWLMGLLSWLLAAMRDNLSQVVLVWLITATIGMLRLHHVVVGTVEVLTGAFCGQGISAADVGRFMSGAALGNIVGGSVFVALIKYGQARSIGEEHRREYASLQ